VVCRKFPTKNRQYPTSFKLLFLYNENYRTSEITQFENRIRKKTMKKILLLITLLFIQPALSKPDKSFKTLIKTPITAFDFFLYRLYNNSKCHFWPGYEIRGTPRCMDKYPQYDSKKNELTLSYIFSVDMTDEFDRVILGYFTSATKKGKIRILMIDMGTLMNDLGLSKYLEDARKSRKKIYSPGLIDKSLILNEADKVDVAKIKDSIKVEARFDYSEYTDYWVIRDTNGEMTVEIRQKPR